MSDARFIARLKPLLTAALLSVRERLLARGERVTPAAIVPASRPEYFGLEGAPEKAQRRRGSEVPDDLQYHVEQWSQDGKHIERVLAAATSVSPARAAFRAAVRDYGDRYTISLRQRIRVACEHVPGEPVNRLEAIEDLAGEIGLLAKDAERFGLECVSAALKRAHREAKHRR